MIKPVAGFTASGLLAASALLLSAAPVGASPEARQPPAPATAGAATPKTAPQAASNGWWLSPIVVNGRKLPIPVALQMLKRALKRPVNFRHENLDKLVCRFAPVTGTHFETLRCETNCQKYLRHEAIMGVHVSTQICATGGRGSPPASLGMLSAGLVGWTNRTRVNRGALEALLAKLPPANSSYTLRVVDHGRVVEEYVFKKGRLVKIWRRSKMASDRPHGH